ncbi:MAG TPA: winged helix DNA-binding domain-containing protein [Gemmatimonadaceae bacterium]|nr:winged helix DNA-binding domain-containing protein [Gemmatimonadaceae bacterium]
MSQIDPCAQRLTSQHLIEPKFDKAGDVVSLLGAVQAQDYAMSKWALGQRMHGATDAAIENEISNGAILRTHVLRPTWHYVAPADIRWMLALTGPRVKATLGHYDRQLGIGPSVIRGAQKVMTTALRGGKNLTRAELAAVMTKAGIRTDGTQRLARLVMHAELDGILCSGPRRGKQFTYALLEERVPPAKKMDRETSLRALAGKYFATRGPATEADFAWWSGLTMADARGAIQSAGSSLEMVVIGGRKHWLGSSSTLKMKSPLVRLLPNYDEYFIGLKDRSAMHAKLKSLGIQASLGGLSGHILIIDGQIAGGWKQTLKPKSVAVKIRLLRPLTRVQQRAVETEATRMAAFLGLPPQLDIGV